MTTISRDQLSHLTAATTAATPGWADAVLAGLNPEGLPPALSTPEVRRLWERPWLLGGADPDHLPRGWADEVLTAPSPDADRVAALALGLATATARSPAHPLVECAAAGEIRHLVRLASSALAGSRAGDRPEDRFRPSDAALACGLWEKFREVSVDWTRPPESIWLGGDDWADGPDAPDAVVPLGDGGRWGVRDSDWVASDVGLPSVCPAAGVLPPVFRAGGLDALSRLEAELRRAGRLAPAQSVHWMGGSAGRCGCPVVRPTDCPLSSGAALELELFRAAGGLLSAAHTAGADRDEVSRLEREAAMLAEVVGRPVTCAGTGPVGSEGGPHDRAASPEPAAGVLRAARLPSASVGEWTRVRGEAAERVAAAADGLLPLAQNPLATPAAGRPPAVATGAAIDAYHALQAAVAAVEDLRQSADPPSAWFDGWRERVVNNWATKPDPLEEELAAKIEKLTADSTPGDGTPHVGGAAADEEFRLDDGYNLDQPNIDWLVEQAARVVEGVARARAAYHAAAGALTPAAGPGGCAYRAALEALAPAAALGERTLGLVPHDPAVNGPAVRVRVAGTRYHAGPPALPADRVAAAARRLPPVRGLLAAAQFQAWKVASKPVSRPRTLSRPAGAVPERQLEPHELDAKMFALAHHPDHDLSERFQHLTRREWADLFGVTETVIRNTRMFGVLKALAAQNRPTPVPAKEAVADGLTVRRRRRRETTAE